MASGTDPVVTTDFSCWPWLHQWMQWHDIDAHTVTREDLAGRTIGMAIKQERRCCRCNQVQLRTEKTTL